MKTQSSCLPALELVLSPNDLPTEMSILENELYVHKWRTGVGWVPYKNKGWEASMNPGKERDSLAAWRNTSKPSLARTQYFILYCPIFHIIVFWNNVSLCSSGWLRTCYTNSNPWPCCLNLPNNSRHTVPLWAQKSLNMNLYDGFQNMS